MKSEEIWLAFFFGLAACIVAILIAYGIVSQPADKEPSKPIELICTKVPNTGGEKWRCYDPILEQIGG